MSAYISFCEQEKRRFFFYFGEEKREISRSAQCKFAIFLIKHIVETVARGGVDESRFRHFEWLKGLDYEFDVVV